MDSTNVIATSGRGDLLKRTLESIRACKKPVGYRGVIVVENGAERKVEKLVSGFQADFPLKYLHIDTANKSAALNHALSDISGGLVYFIDDDVRLEENALCAMSSAASNRDSKFFLGGPVLSEYEVLPGEELAKIFLLHPGIEFPVSGVAEVSQPCFYGANFAARADDLRSIGGFPLAFGPTEDVDGEDDVVQRKLLDYGAKGYYVPEARAWHYIFADQVTIEWILKKQFRRAYTLLVFTEINFFQAAGRVVGLVLRTIRDFCMYCGYMFTGNTVGKNRIRYNCMNYYGSFCGIIFGRSKREKMKKRVR